MGLYIKHMIIKIIDVFIMLFIILMRIYQSLAFYAFVMKSKIDYEERLSTARLNDLEQYE